jgi:replicative DNA helicase
VVLFIYRGDLFEANKPDVGAQLLVAKQRHGPVGTVKLRFDDEAVRFDPRAHPSHHQAQLHGAH